MHISRFDTNPWHSKSCTKTTVLQKAWSRGGHAARNGMADLEVEGEGEEGMSQEGQVLCPCQSRHLAEILSCYNPFLASREPIQGAECPALSPIEGDRV